jgi:phosphate starvation-inducible protein PhoH
VSMMNPLAGPAGPGKFSTRTDKLELGSTAYGEGVETQAIKSGAPLAKTGDVRPARAGDVREAAEQAPVTELFAPTQRPEEDIMTGNKLGPGPGPEVLGMNPVTRKLSDILAEMIPYDNTGEVAILYQNALARGN